MKRHILRKALFPTMTAAVLAAGCSGETQTTPTSSLQPPQETTTTAPDSITDSRGQAIIDKIEFLPNASKHPNEKIFRILDVIGGDGQTVEFTDNTGQVLDTRAENDEIPIECISENHGMSTTAVALLREELPDGSYEVTGPAIGWLSFEALLEAQNRNVPTCPPGIGTRTASGNPDA